MNKRKAKERTLARVVSVPGKAGAGAVPATPQSGGGATTSSKSVTPWTERSGGGSRSVLSPKGRRFSTEPTTTRPHVGEEVAAVPVSGISGISNETTATTRREKSKSLGQDEGLEAL